MTSTRGDLIIELRGKCAAMYRWRKDLGYSQPRAAKLAGVSPGLWNAYECLRESPVGGDRWGNAQWKPSAERVAACIGMPADEIWPPSLLKITNPRAVIELDSQAAHEALEEWGRNRLDVLPADARHDDAEKRRMIQATLETLSPREQHVVRRRVWDESTYRDIADELHVGPERVRQIEMKALRKLRHPSRLKLLREFA